MAYRFKNWAGTKRCRPRALHLPESEADVAAIVRRAAESGETVKVVGGGHSWTDIACTDGHQMSLDRLCGVLEVDRDRSRVRVQGGLRLKALNAALAEHGLAMRNLGSIAEQSIAGAIATGTHGTGVGLGNLSSYVVGLRLVTGEGRVVEAAEGTDLLRAARVALGCLGVATEVTLQCEPAFALAETARRVSFDDAVRSMESLARGAEWVKLWWLPHTDTVQVYRYERTTAPAVPRGAFTRWSDGQSRHLFTGLLSVGALVPSMIPAINRLVRAVHLTKIDRVDRSDRILNIAMPPVHREMEYAIPLAEAGAALAELRDFIERERLRVNFVTELRFVAGDDAWLSPTYGRASCCLGAYMAESRGIERYFAGYEQLMLARGGRPHWGKEFTIGQSALRGLYPEFDRFDALRRELDPRGVFENDFTGRVFGART